ncbi:MAG: CO dehydrogenase/acetyl-CoA synthase subunit delta [Nitrososphaeria archaeon]|nr:CO dehydrogenase/acetyl-CoA synthase subunit delta [Nitrososphaeria archaeon]NIN51586.1 CO dehydrogenase/acetyl-CoA synthase subunit delta [Nitrososphaeria archaeon]NIQ32071.1 CO dehydrogenase/acetyl-CoA synthase subunit delta [Nitrososphaeria archaeon]
MKFDSKLLDLLSKFEELELEDVDLEIGDLEIWLQPPTGAVATPKIVAPPAVKPLELLKAKFSPPVQEYPGQILEVKLGATKTEGGSRGKSIVIGGEKSPAFYLFESSMLHPPVLSFDVFDTKIPLAKAVKMHVEEVVEDPAAWAKLSVDKFGAEMVNLHLVSVDPLVKDTSPQQAAKTVEEVLQAVDVPLAVGGSGDPGKDMVVFEKIAEASEGERLLFNSVTLDMDVERIGKAIEKHGHTTISFTSMDMAKARELNRRLYEVLPRERIVIDTTTAALGYGLDYAFSIMERTRLAGLLGDEELQHPMSSGTTNAWAAREAWMKMAPEWGPRELRGPIWETVTALTLLLTGVDYFMMMHPSAVKTVKEVVDKLTNVKKGSPERISDWVTVKI